MNMNKKQSFDYRFFLMQRERTFQPVNYDKPYQAFIEYAVSGGIASYGKRIPKKIVYDLDHVIQPNKAKDNNGDVSTISTGINTEFKTSIESKNGTFSLCRLRSFHNFEYFIINLLSLSKNGLKSNFFCISKAELFGNPEFKLTYMNGNAETNEGNVFVERRLTLKKQDAFRLFGQYNLLAGTSYNDLKRFFYKLNGMKTNGTFYKSKKRSVKVATPVIQSKTEETV